MLKCCMGSKIKTVTLINNSCDEPQNCFKEPVPVVFSSLYPIEFDVYEALTVAKV